MTQAQLAKSKSLFREKDLEVPGFDFPSFDIEAAYPSKTLPPDWEEDKETYESYLHFWNTMSKTSCFVAQENGVFIQFSEGRLFIEPYRLRLAYKTYDHATVQESVNKAVTFCDKLGAFYNSFHILRTFSGNKDLVSTEVCELRWFLDLMEMQEKSGKAEFNTPEAKKYKLIAERLVIQFLINFFYWEKPVRTYKKGYAYLIAGEKNQYKIGRTVNIKTRMKDMFPILLPFTPKLELYFECESPERVERALHKTFQFWRLNGEWFELSPEKISILNELKFEGFIKSVEERE